MSWWDFADGKNLNPTVEDIHIEIGPLKALYTKYLMFYPGKYMVINSLYYTYFGSNKYPTPKIPLPQNY